MILTALYDSYPEPAVPQRLRGISYVGRHVAKLPQWRYIKGLHFLVEAKGTSERSAPRVMRKASQRRSSQGCKAKTDKSSVSAIDVRNLIHSNDPNGQTKGGVFSHFYHGLPPEVKALMMQKFQAENFNTTENQYVLVCLDFPLTTKLL